MFPTQVQVDKAVDMAIGALIVVLTLCLGMLTIVLCKLAGSL